MHRAAAAERAAVVPHGAQPAQHAAGARAAALGPVGLGRRAAQPLRARVRRRLHHQALRLRIGHYFVCIASHSTPWNRIQNDAR